MRRFRKFTEIFRNLQKSLPAPPGAAYIQMSAVKRRDTQERSGAQRGKDKKMKTEKDMKELEQVNGGGFYEEMMEILHKIIPNPYDTDQDEKTDKTDVRTGRGKC